MKHPASCEIPIAENNFPSIYNFNINISYGLLSEIIIVDSDKCAYIHCNTLFSSTFNLRTKISLYDKALTGLFSIILPPCVYHPFVMVKKKADQM